MIQKRNIKAIGDLPQNPFATFTNQFTSIPNASIVEKFLNKACAFRTKALNNIAICDY